MSATPLTAPEPETVVTTSDADDTVRVWTAQRRHITRLRRDSAFTEVASGTHGNTPWAEFTTDAERWTPAGVTRTRAVSDAQRVQLADRLRAVRTGDRVAPGGTSVAHGAVTAAGTLNGANLQPAAGGAR